MSSKSVKKVIVKSKPGYTNRKLGLAIFPAPEYRKGKVCQNLIKPLFFKYPASALRCFIKAIYLKNFPVL